MIDPELEKHLKIIENELLETRTESSTMPRTLWRGIVYGVGYVIGVIFIVVIVGWILNIVGVIPALSEYAGEFRTALERFGGSTK